MIMEELEFDVQEYISLEETIKELTEKRDKIKEQMFDYLNVQKVSSMDFGDVQATIVSPKPSTSLDVKMVEQHEPETYSRLFEKYQKTTSKNPYIKVTIKK